MSKTVQNVVDAAVERSNLNDPDLISTTELYQYVTLLEQNAFLIAAKVNPDYFGREGNTATRGSYTATWSLTAAPGNIAAVSKVEVNLITGTVTGVSIGDEVSIVSIRNPETGLAPRAYLRNKTIYDYNSEMSTNASNYVTRLKIYYSYLSPARTGSSDTLDLPDEHANLIIIPLARIMAIRDQRVDELPGLDAEWQLAITSYLNHLGVFDEVTIREFSTIPAAAPDIGAPPAQNG